MVRSKKWILLTVCSLTVALCTTAIWEAHRTQERLAEKLIRLHVIANSDSEEDQTLKLHVRDTVLSQAEEILSDCTDMSQAEERLKTELDRLSDSAQETASLYGCDDPITATLSYETYPTRNYDSFRLPAGRYLSLRLTIGEGKGRNWWCVVFPPLCNAAVTEEFAEIGEAAGLTGEEVALMTQETGKYVVRFKLIEWAETLLH